MKKGYCKNCGNEIEVQMCCSGRGCGCQGLPIDPPICEKKECWDKLMNKTKTNN